MMKKLLLGIAVCCGISGVNGMDHPCIYRCGKTDDGIDKIIMRDGRSNVDFCYGYTFRKPFGYIAPYRKALYDGMMDIVKSFAVSIDNDALEIPGSPIYEVSRSAVFDVVAYALEMMNIDVFIHVSGYEPFSNILKLSHSCEVDSIKESLSEQIKTARMPQGSVCLDDCGYVYINHEQKLWADDVIAYLDPDPNSSN